MRYHLTGRFYLCEEHKEARPDIQDDCVGIADWPEVASATGERFINVHACAVQFVVNREWQQCTNEARRVLKIFVDSENTLSAADHEDRIEEGLRLRVEDNEEDARWAETCRED